MSISGGFFKKIDPPSPQESWEKPAALWKKKNNPRPEAANNPPAGRGSRGPPPPTQQGKRKKNKRNTGQGRPGNSKKKKTRRGGGREGESLAAVCSHYPKQKKTPKKEPGEQALPGPIENSPTNGWAKGVAPRKQTNPKKKKKQTKKKKPKKKGLLGVFFVDFSKFALATTENALIQ